MRNIDPDERLASEFTSDNWSEKLEPEEVRRVGESIARSTALRPAAARDKKDGIPREQDLPVACDQPDKSDPPEAHEKSRYVASDRSTGLDGFGGGAVAFDRTPSYFATELSGKISRTPEGFLICRNAVIARTGFQVYKVSEIADPEGLLEGYRGDEEISLWRDPSEVFSPATIASFEGKSLTLTHPDKLLDPANDADHNVGHVQNVRAGSEPLGNGELPLLADIIVKGEAAIRAIENGARELSCGYSYRLSRSGFRFDQKDIIGNHVALVESGRAGNAVRIYDSIPSANRRKPLSEIAATDAMYRDHGRRQVEAIRSQIRRTTR